MAPDPTVGAGNSFFVPFPVLALASNGDDIFLTAGGGGSTSVKEVPNEVHAHRYCEVTNKLSTIAALNTGTNLVVSLSYSPATKLWLASARDKCKVLSLDTEANTLSELCEFATEAEGKEPEQNFAVCSPDGSFIVTGGTDGQVKLWKMGGKEKEEPPTFHRNCGSRTKEVLDGAFSPDGQHVAACDGTGNCRLWKVEEDDQAASEEGKLFKYDSAEVKGTALIKLVRFLPSADGGSTLMFGANGTQRKMNFGVVGLFNLDGDQLASVRIDTGPLKSMSLTVDNKRLVVGLMAGKKVVCKLPGLKLLKKTKELHSLPAQCVAFTNLDTAISVSGDRDIHLLRIREGDKNFGFLVQVILLLIVAVYLMYRIGMVGALVGQGRTDL